MDALFYEWPVWISMPTFVLAYLAASWGVLLAVRPFVRRAASANEEWDRVLGYAMASYGVFYGILLALIAVSVYENFQRVHGIVLDEASALSTLYRAVSAYPDPTGTELKDLLAVYTQNVIAVDWPQQQAGAIPIEGNADVSAIQSILLAFEPTTGGQEALHNQTIAQFFDFVELRRDRLDETDLALPVLLWVLLGVGAVLNALMLALVEARNLRIHLIMSGIIAIFVGLLIFITAAMDHPYSGVIAVTPDAFSEVYEQLMGGRVP